MNDNEEKINQDLEKSTEVIVTETQSTPEVVEEKLENISREFDFSSERLISKETGSISREAFKNNCLYKYSHDFLNDEFMNIRKALRYSQDDIALTIGMSKSDVDDIETGKAELDLVSARSLYLLILSELDNNIELILIIRQMPCSYYDLKRIKKSTRTFLKLANIIEENLDTVENFVSEITDIDALKYRQKISSKGNKKKRKSKTGKRIRWS